MMQIVKELVCDLRNGDIIDVDLGFLDKSQKQIKRTFEFGGLEFNHESVRPQSAQMPLQMELPLQRPC